MTSLLTNTSAMTALQTLTQTNKNLAQSQNRIATGQRVSTASDNAAYWSIATTMRSDNKALGAVQDALGLGAATIDTMYTGLNGTVEVVSEIKAKLVAARTPGVDRDKIQSEIGELQKQLQNTADSAVFNGENWISVDSTAASYNATKSVVSSFSRAGGQVQVDTVTVDLNAIKLYDANLDTAYAAQAFPTVTTAARNPTLDVGGNITVTVGAAPALNIAVAAGTSLKDIAKEINKLGIEGLSVGINTAGDALAFKSRNDANVVIDASVAGLGGAVTLTALAAPVDSNKGILDKTYDAYTGTAWETFSVADIDISKLTDNATDLAKLETYISAVDDALGTITDAATNLGAIKNRIGLQQDFVKALKDSLDRGIGQLVDADMNAESTRLQALQTQQQLGIQALSIANSGSQSILSLFRG
ncbi:MAG: flagellin [Beijerinckiaceae bacterium]|uniref:flagellin N-terminal helical domain-containing protein n=1 Tax=Bosea sp. (in: a-proteobacteria) TaxID=1871050 RepID=UPI001DF3E8B4|nr:flagellin [Bosea sp. (in: a-proteobacteria)]MBX9874320.1 flagellin [Beijerinckiaceae bacterium]WRH56642.1 MAG: flagellin [Bosea sp. (in: a-proteobacteria)]